MSRREQRPEPDFDAVADILTPGGECADCKEHAERRTALALIPGNSGPGWTVYGCIPCVKKRAGFAMPSEWLCGNVARLIKAGL